MENTPLLSICIASYNVEKYIKQCLDSILIDTYPNKEIIIVDDCSTDKTVEVIKKWEKQNNIKLILEQSKNNQGPGPTYNKTCKLAKGEYITILDSDDFLIDDLFSEKIKIFKNNPELKIVYGNGKIYKNGELMENICDHNFYEQIKREPNEIYEYITTNLSPFWLQTSVIKRSFFINICGGFDEEVLSNDRVANIRIFQHIKSKKEYDFIDQPAFAYRLHNTNITQNSDRIEKLLKQVIDKYCPEEKKKNGYSNIYYARALTLIYQKKFILKSLKLFLLSQRYKFNFNKSIGYIGTLLMPKSIIDRIPNNIKIFIKSFIKL